LGDVDVASICYGGGFIVGPSVVLPEDGSTSYEQGKAPLGCNRLRCCVCGSSIRQSPGWKDGPAFLAGGGGLEQVKRNAASVFQEKDWSRSNLLVADKESRLYACSCSLVTVTGRKAAVMPDRVWACAGHPSAGAAPGMLNLRDENMAILYSPNIDYLRVDLGGMLHAEPLARVIESPLLFDIVARKNRTNVVLNGIGLWKFGTDYFDIIAERWATKASSAGVRRVSVIVQAQVFELFGGLFPPAQEKARSHGIDLRFFPDRQFTDSWESVSWFTTT